MAPATIRKLLPVACASVLDSLALAGVAAGKSPPEPAKDIGTVQATGAASGTASPEAPQSYAGIWVTP